MAATRLGTALLLTPHSITNSLHTTTLRQPKESLTTKRHAFWISIVISDGVKICGNTERWSGKDLTWLYTNQLPTSVMGMARN